MLDILIVYSQPFILFFYQKVIFMRAGPVFVFADVPGACNRAPLLFVELRTMNLMIMWVSLLKAENNWSASDLF